MILDATHVQTSRSATSIHYVVVRRMDGNICVTMNSKGDFFAPLAWDSSVVRLILADGTSVHGMLHIIRPDEHARGCMFDYRFIPVDPASAGLVDTSEDSFLPWSNVDAIVLPVGAGSLRIPVCFRSRDRAAS